MIVDLPIRTVSEANAHTHWRERARRAKTQRLAAGVRVLAAIGLAPAPQLPLVITLTRIAPRKLDSDNLAGSLKHVRDGIADVLGFNDRDERCTWVYDQQRGAVAGSYSVLVGIEAVEGGRASKSAPGSTST